MKLKVSSEDNLPKILCMNCCKKLDSIHKFASMAVKMQDKLKMLVETGSVEDMKEHSILHSILSKGPESECEVTEVEVRVDPMLFLCALEDGSSDGEDNSNSNETATQPSAEPPVKMEPAESGSSSSLPASEESITASTSSASTSSVPTRTVSAVVSTATTAPVNTAASTVSAVPSPVILRQTSPQPPMPEKETKPYICSVCSRGFYNEIGLQNHLWSHLPQDRRVLSNTVGNNLERQAPVYSSRGVLHTNTAVTSVMRFVCPICGKKISTKGNLKVHLETHRPKGKYGCDICGRVFKTQSNLYRHKDYHGGVQFPCGVCGRVYPTNSTLRAHSITHSDLRPHACPLCDKTFKRNQDLKCPYCPKAFASSGNCFSHRKRMHPQEVERDRERAAQLMRFENKMNIVYVKMKILAAVEW
ncbi:Serendipity locus protein H-1 [Gryllus bimaculatus]|nr:Serendipity locus protein H-1 [Gryllus bimaculatus]